MMETILLFGILWVVLAVLIVILSDTRAALALLGLNLAISVFLLTETDVFGAVATAIAGTVSAAIVLLAASRTRMPQQEISSRVLVLAALLTIVASYLVAFSLQGQLPAGHTFEGYFLVILFGISLLTIISQKSILKLLLGILILENIATLILAWAKNAALFTVISEVFVVLITFTIAFIAIMDFAEYDTIDGTELTKLRG